ncbi:hypothetical protein PV08_10372 [Exophiala spinifera]|uniref:NmrA-like domain-containing protein n=1 Tax=Exophiala spinifera TaxID=91928 RepID=A0A0D2AWK4_9EURO|nr:uncharacterized protein PV08_10372 [Exophiala spinifera]KIW11073.1 hypothetical protein PV08_10372 [Exophiala spinifera]
MSKILAVFGATGQQGGSIVNFVLNDSELSKQYRVRGVTRDASSASAEALKRKGVEVVSGDVTKPSSLTSALHGVHTVFALTAPSFGPDSRAREYDTGKAIADAAVAAGATYIILSTLPNVSVVSGGKYKKVTGFDAKADVEDYIKTLPIKSAFFAPGSFMQNWQSLRGVHPSGTPGEFVVSRHVGPGSKLPLIDIVGDTGKFVGAILAEPDKYEGKTFCAATKLYGMAEMCEIMSKQFGKTVKYVQVSAEQHQAVLAGAVGDYAEALIEMMSYQEEFGYYGPKTEELVQWAAEHARGQVTTFEEYLEKNPIAALQ